MSFGVNTVNISGCLGKDASVHETKDNAGFISFSMAVRDDKKKPDGTYEKGTIWVPVSWYTFGIHHQAERLKKGVEVLVSGRFKQDEWTKDGVKQTRLAVFASEVAFLSKPDRQTAKATTASKPPADDEGVPF